MALAMQSSGSGLQNSSELPLKFICITNADLRLPEVSVAQSITNSQTVIQITTYINMHFFNGIHT